MANITVLEALQLSLNATKKYVDNKVPYYNEILITEISGEDYNSFRSNSYFNMNALNLDETKSYIGKDINITDNTEYTFEFVYDKETDALIDEYSDVYIYNHKSYDGTNFTENENSAVLTFGITPMDATSEVEGYIRLYEIDKVVLNNGCLSSDLTIKNSLTVGKRIGNIGDFSVSEGYLTTASSIFSHAEGYLTTASGDYSHAEGGSTRASGAGSHAEGTDTTASGTSSHAEGFSATASGTNSHAEGKSSNSATSVIRDLSSSTSDNSIITAWNSNKFSLAKGTASHVEGTDNLALDNYSHAEGASTIASGYISHAEGDSTTASGYSSHAEGSVTTASSDCSHAEGNNTTASGNISHAEGNNTTASGHSSHAEGRYTTSLGNNSHAEGESSNSISAVISDFSSSTSNDVILTAWNTNKFSLAKGEASHVEGKDNLALNDYSHAEGNSTTASSNYSHAEGFRTTASDNSSHAEGSWATASGVASHAEGSGTTSSGQYQHVQGKYNIEDTENKYAHIVGNGTADNARSNAHTLDWNGNAWYQGKLSQDGTPTEDKDLVTKKYVDDKVAEANASGGYTHPDSHPASMITGLATVATSGSYNDLNDKPVIPSIDGLASESYVNNAVAGLVDSAPEALNTLNELATALGNDANFATTISNQIGLKANSADLATVATSGSYNDLSDKPTIPAAYTHPASHPASMITGLHTVATSGDYNDLNNKPSIPTVTNDLTDSLKANYDAAYTHSTSAHAPSNAQKNSDITKSEIEAKLTGNITTHTHSQYLTSIPSEYITEQELTSKGYATESQINSAIEAAATTDEEVKTTVNQILGGVYIE